MKHSWKSLIVACALVAGSSCSRPDVPISEQTKSLCDDAYSKNHNGDYAGALADCNKAIKLDSNCWPAYDDRGIAKCMLNKDFVGAINDFDKAIELNPKDSVLYNDRGYAKLEIKDYHGAIGDFDKAIELSPKDARLYVNRSSAKSYIKDDEGADIDYKKALELDPQINIGRDGIVFKKTSSDK